MATAVSPQIGRESRVPADWSLADLHAHLGGIPLERIRLFPPPGTATLADVMELDAGQAGLCELIDGVLVEKTVGWYESLMAGLFVQIFNNYLDEHDLGKALTADATLQILPEQLRIPDACFIGWDRFPEEKLPTAPMPALVPDLVVEVLSIHNTQVEMDRKLRDYFQAGVRLVWYVDPRTKTARVFSAIDEIEDVGPSGCLDGRDILPGLTIPLAELFARADRTRLE